VNGRYNTLICNVHVLSIGQSETHRRMHTPCMGVMSKSPIALADPDTEKSKATLPVLCIVSSSSLLLVKITCLKSRTLRSSRNPTVEDSPERVQRYSGPPVTTHTAVGNGIEGWGSGKEGKKK
jgi:hypothetical protein